MQTRLGGSLFIDPPHKMKSSAKRKFSESIDDIYDDGFEGDFEEADIKQKPSEPIKFKCDGCESLWSQQWDLTRHLKRSKRCMRKRGIELPTKKDKNGLCTICGEKALYENEVKVGMRCEEHKIEGDTIPSKKCSTCKKSKSIIYFSSCKNSALGVFGSCKSCKAELRRKKLEAKDPNFIVTRKDKYCPKCQITHNVEEYGIEHSTFDGLTWYCRGCSWLYTMELKEFRDNIMVGKSCENCGYNKDVRGLEKAHINREEKARTKNGTPLCFGELTSLNKMKEEAKKIKILCKICHRLETRQENLEISKLLSSKNKGTISWRHRKNITAEFVNAEKLKRGSCLVCDLKVTPDNYCVFDFDHRIPSEKFKKISTLVSRTATRPVLEKEMQKCNLLCAICHWIKTLDAGEAGYHSHRK